MAVTFHTDTNDITRTTVTDGTSNTTLTINVPSNVVNGNLMIAVLHCNAALNPNSITPPEGWTQIVSNFSANGNFAVHTWIGWRIASSEPSSYAWTIGGDGRDDHGWMFRVTGHDATTPIDVAGTFTSDTVLAPVCPSITTATANALAVWVCAGKNGTNAAADNTSVKPTAATQVLFKKSRTNSNGVASGVAYELRASTGATGTRTWTGFYPSTQSYSSAVGFAIREGASGLSITSVTPSSFDDGVTGIVIAGSGFGSATGTVAIAGVSQAVTAWADTSITVTSVLGTNKYGPTLIKVTPA